MQVKLMNNDCRADEEACRFTSYTHDAKDNGKGRVVVIRILEKGNTHNDVSRK